MKFISTVSNSLLILLVSTMAQLALAAEQLACLDDGRCLMCTQVQQCVADPFWPEKCVTGSISPNASYIIRKSGCIAMPDVDCYGQCYEVNSSPAS